MSSVKTIFKNSVSGAILYCFDVLIEKKENDLITVEIFEMINNKSWKTVQYKGLVVDVSEKICYLTSSYERTISLYLSIDPIN